MRPQNHRLLLASTTVAAVVAALAVVPVAGAKPRAAKTVSKNVIVVLKNQHSSLKPKRGVGNNRERARVIASDQSHVVAAARKLGATRIRQFNVVNAFSATLSTSKIAQLSQDSNVAAIVPDLPITRPDASADHGSAKKNDNEGGIPTSTYCSTDPKQPRLEPEALQTMHVAYDDSRKPSAAKLEDGSGVKVGWIADGLDINNPDFIRANGAHVFVDYQDFSGDGLDAPTTAKEAFGDASSIAAQGRQTYNLNDFASAANPLPDGCYVRIQGVAPGASLVGLKVFGNSHSAPTSHFISAIQYAVVTAGVDVLNESFGRDPYPDNIDDPIALVNDAAILAGVTVVASTGDSGTNGTIGSPATSPRVIAAGATTTFRSAAQIKIDGFSNPAAGIKGWANDNISSLSSGGYAHDGKVPDVAAPGDSGWALCTPDLKLYKGCVGEDGNPTPMQLFGGTSESSPLTAGTAALVIAAYKRAHGGARPSPGLVKSIIVGTAQDLGHPAFEQGAGEVDALAAVKAALSTPAPGSSTVPGTATGAQLVTKTSHLGVDQLDLSGPAGSTVSGNYTLTNASAFTQRVSLTTRSLTRTLSTQHGRISLNANKTFPNVVGAPRAFKFIDVVVPPGASRLDGSIAMNQSPFTVFFALIDPFGIFQAYNSPQGIANFSHIDVRFPTPGHWKAMVWADPLFAHQTPNKIHFEFTTSQYTSFGRVSPSSVTLAPGASATINASFPTGSNAGDTSAAVVMTSSLGASSNMPVSIRSLIPTSAATNTFRGVLTGGNGRGFDAESHKYFLDIPLGKKAVGVTVHLSRPQHPNEVFVGFLVGPNGHTLSARSNLIVNKKGFIDVGTATFNFVRSPEAGRWTFVLLLTTPSGGDVVNQPFVGTVRFTTAAVSASLPTSATTLTRGKTYRFAVKVTNNSNEQQLYFADPRLDQNTEYHLASQTPGDDLQRVSLPNPENLPQWLVPTSTSAVSFTANATLPVGLDVAWTYGDPEVFGLPQGNSASVNLTARPEVANGPWSGEPGEPGPFNGPAPKGIVALNAIVTTKAFDLDADSSVGDYWSTSLVPARPAEATPTGVASLGHHNRYLNAAQTQASTTPVRHLARSKVRACNPAAPILNPGQSCTITFTITPSAAHGATVRGHLHIQTLDFFGGTTNDLASLAYAYKVK